MRLIIDGDACPVKDLVHRAALRLDLALVLVSNRPMAFGQEAGVTAIVVPEGPDQADRWIVEAVLPGDLVITADIPLAAEVVARGAIALGHRGEVFDDRTVGDRLATWALHRQLRDQGLDLGGPKGYGPQDRTAFANAFDRCIRQLARRKPTA